MRVLMISSEVYSLARTGGLGDAVEALAKGLAKHDDRGRAETPEHLEGGSEGGGGAQVMVVTPRYATTKLPSDATLWPNKITLRWVLFF